MRYKKFSNFNNLEHKTSINSLEEIPLPNEIEIENNIENELDDESKHQISEKKSFTSLSRLFKNIAIDDILLVSILILLLQEEMSDELLICFIAILLIQK